MPGAGLVGGLAAHDGATGRSAGGADVVVGEAEAIGEELVDVRSLDDGIAGAGEVPVTLIIGDDEDDVGRLRRG